MKKMELKRGVKYTGLCLHGRERSENSGEVHVCGFKSLAQAGAYARDPNRNVVIYLFDESGRLVRVIKSGLNGSVSVDKNPSQVFPAFEADCEVVLLEEDPADSVFAVVDETFDGFRISIDSEESCFEEIEKANEHARMIWEHLTNKERERRRVYVAEIHFEDLEEWGIDEGRVVWLVHGDVYPSPGAFDSEKLMRG